MRGTGRLTAPERAAHSPSYPEDRGIVASERVAMGPGRMNTVLLGGALGRRGGERPCSARAGPT